MVLFIFESIGTSELLLVGIVALIFLGPRKLPELAKKAGKIMTGDVVLNTCLSPASTS